MDMREIISKLETIKTEDEYLQCKNNIFEELINFVYLSEDIKKFHIMIVQYQDAPFKNLQFIKMNLISRF